MKDKFTVLVILLTSLYSLTIPAKTCEKKQVNYQTIINNQVITEPCLVQLLAGKFVMGLRTGSDNERPTHDVEMSSYYIAKAEVSFNEWENCVNMGGCLNFPDDNGWGRNSNPIINVSWEDTQDYIQWLNKKTAKNYRLPTEAEWEYACIMGRKKQEDKTLDDEKEKQKKSKFWFFRSKQHKEDERFIGIHHIAKNRANTLGLYDMTENAWEWVEDWYDDKAYTEHQEANPIYQKKGQYRVYRGGSWFIKESRKRCRDRDQYPPGNRLNILGFRLAHDL